MREQLERHPLFQGVKPEQLDRALSGTDVTCISRGETVYDRLRFRRCLGVILEGELTVRKESLLVSTLRPGDIFGAAALFNEQEDYPTTLTARSDCRLVLIPQEAVRQLIGAGGAFAENYVSYLSGRIRFLSDRLDTLSADGGEGKLVSYLLSAANEDGALTISATQLSQRIGVGRATLYRAFESLEQENVIARKGKTIRILDVKKLHALWERA